MTALASLTIATSASCIIGQCGSVLTLTMCSGWPEPARVLHGSADAEGEVQARVDDDTGGADLAGVGQPTAVGDHTRRSDGGIECGSDRGELIESAG